MWLNVLLVYLFVRRLSGSREAAAIAALLHCYQPNYFPMYYGSGYCFDVSHFSSATLLSCWYCGPGRLGGCYVRPNASGSRLLFACAVTPRGDSVLSAMLLIL